MKRRLVTIAILLLAGAVVNFAIAWTCIIFFGGLGDEETFMTTKEEAAWLLSNIAATADQDWEVREETTVIRTFGAEYRIIAAIDVEAAPPEGIMAWRHERGWPLFSFRGDGFRHLQRQPGRYRLVSEWYLGAAQLPWFSWNGTAIRVPIGIVWPGFAVNTFSYATILWLLIPGPFALRRIIRRRRGLCLACGYELRHGEHEACPECGVTA